MTERQRNGRDTAGWFVAAALAVAAGAMVYNFATGNGTGVSPADDRQDNTPQPTAAAGDLRGPATGNEDGPAGNPVSVRDADAIPAELAEIAGRLSSGARDPDVITDEYVIGLRDYETLRAFLKAADARGIEILDVIEEWNMVRLRSASIVPVAKAVADMPEPVNCCRNYRVSDPSPVQPPADASPVSYVAFGELAADWLGAREERWSWGNGITVGVLDEGILPAPGLDEDRLIRIDLIADNETGLPANGHGTAVASILAGTGENLTGIAPAVSLLDVKVMSDSGEGDTFTVARGIMAAVDRGADIVMLCLGSRGDSPALQRAVDYAAWHGVAVVAAAGNDGVEGISYPAKYESVVSVTAVDAARRRLHAANLGTENDVAAPGVGVTVVRPDGSNVLFSGTSAAVPFVVGTIAAMMSEQPGLSSTGAAQLVVEHSDDLGMPGKDGEFGSGVLNIQRALDHETDGVVDIALADHHLPASVEPGQDVPLLVCVQNRGTERVELTRVTTTVDGASETETLRGIDPGSTKAFEVILQYDEIIGRTVTVLSRAFVPRGKDRNRANNVIATSISIEANGEIRWQKTFVGTIVE